MKRIPVAVLGLAAFAAGASTVRTESAEAVTGVVQIATGETRVVGGRPPYAYYRFSIKGKYQGNTTDGCEIGEIALYDAAGVRLNLNLANIGNSRPIAELTEGSFTLVENGSAGRGPTHGEAPQMAFDGDVGTKCYLAACRPDPADSATWPNFVMRLSAGAASVVAYNFCTGNDTQYGDGNRTPVSWRLEGSVDGVTWCVLADETDSPAAVVKNSTWYNDGTPLAVDERTFPNPRAQYRLAPGGTLEIAADSMWDTILNDGGTIQIGTDASAVWNVPASGLAELPGGGLAGTGTLVKRGAGRLEVGGFNDAFAGTIRVEQGVARFVPVQAPVAAKVYRLSFKEFVGSGYYEVGEIALYDRDGNRLNLNLTAGSSDPTQIGYGQMSVTPSPSNSSSAHAFDGDLSTKLEGTQSGPTVGGDTSKWVRVLMRLPQGAAPVAGYNIASGNDVRAYPERNPVAWVLEASEDGVNWTTLDDRNFETSRIAYVNKTWFNGGKMFPVHATSNCAPAFVTDRRYFRFNIRAKSVMTHGNFELSELALFDVCGNRVNLNLTNVGNSKGAAALTPGSFTFQENGSAGRSDTDNEASQKVFDGSVETKAFIGGLNKTAEPWPCFIMRLADDAAPVAAYGLATGNDTANTGRTPVSWSLEDSEDGVTWRTVAEESDALESGLLVNANKRWANNGFPIGLSSGDRCLAPTAATVFVSDGATLVLPTEQGAGLSHLVVDCTSAGTIENFKAAEGLVLDLVNFRAFRRGGEVRAGKALPIRFVGEVDLSTVATWTIRLDGKPNRNYSCTVSDGTIVISGGPGAVVILR